MHEFAFGARSSSWAAERATGDVIGGISPLGQRECLPPFVDASALAQPTVSVSAGRRGVMRL